MVRHGYDLNLEIVWLRGAEFKNERQGWSALVRMRDNCLDVFAYSKNPEKPVNMYIDIMRDSILKINEEIGLKAQEYIIYSKNGLQDRFAYELLQGSKEIGNNYIYSKVFQMISIDEILGSVNGHDTIIGQKHTYQIESLLNTLTSALLKLQNNTDYHLAGEYSCTIYIRDMLEQYGYLCFDQSLHGVSGVDRSAGLFDLLIRKRNDWRDLSIYEAIRMNAFDKKQLNSHIKKMLYTYNFKGIDNLILVSYVGWDKDRFHMLSNRYSNFVSSGESLPFTVVESQRMDFLSDTFLRCQKVGYDCGGTVIFIYHIIVRVAA